MYFNLGSYCFSCELTIPFVFSLIAVGLSFIVTAHYFMKAISDKMSGFQKYLFAAGSFFIASADLLTGIMLMLDNELSIIEQYRFNYHFGFVFIMLSILSMYSNDVDIEDYETEKNKTSGRQKAAVAVAAVVSEVLLLCLAYYFSDWEFIAYFKFVNNIFIVLWYLVLVSLALKSNKRDAALCIIISLVLCIGMRILSEMPYGSAASDSFGEYWCESVRFMYIASKILLLIAAKQLCSDRKFMSFNKEFFKLKKV